MRQSKKAKEQAELFDAIMKEVRAECNRQLKAHRRELARAIRGDDDPPQTGGIGINPYPTFSGGGGGSSSTSGTSVTYTAVTPNGGGFTLAPGGGVAQVVKDELKKHDERLIRTLRSA